jgi:hypothetical protein
MTIAMRGLLRFWVDKEKSAENNRYTLVDRLFDLPQGIL